MFEYQKKIKYGNKRYFYINLHLKYRLDTEFTATAKASWCQTKRWHHLPYPTHIA